MRIALVVTVRNEADTIGELLASIDAQTRGPDEVVIVDGGSADGTAEIVDAWSHTKPGRLAVSAAGANIAAGRNVAISRSGAPAVAVTDAGCVLDPMWLEHLGRALDDADVAMGYYVPRNAASFERIATCLDQPGSDEIAPERFMPSSRSVAFRREVWERVGGYPEWLDIGEDMYFDFAVMRAGVRRRFVPDALVTWRTRSNLRDFVRQYFAYARGDAIAGMYPQRHALRFGSYGATIVFVAASLRWPWLVALPIAAAGFWLRRAYARAARRLRGAERVVAFVALPFLNAIQDAAKMAGYVAGLPHRKRSR